MKTSRLGRIARLGGMAVGVAGDVAKARLARDTHRAAAERLASTLGELKGLPHKVGQILSTLDDALPAEHRDVYREVLGKLQARAPAEDPVAVLGVLRSELGDPDQVFAEFDSQPIAAASIGQVYAATLHDGRRVVVKVQYPGVAQAIHSDLANVEGVVATMSAVLPNTDLRPMLEDAVGRIAEELDYEQEARSQALFARIWDGHPDVVVPAIVPELCTPRVLVSERVDGDGWEEFLARASAEERCRAGVIIWSFVFGSLHGHGVFNADPHPGNYLFLPDGRVAFLDYGCVQRFPMDIAHTLAELRNALVVGASEGDKRFLTRRVFDLERLDDKLWAELEPYLALTVAPMRGPQPWRFDRSYTEQLMEQAIQSKQRMALSFVRRGVPTARRPGIVFLGRINAGLAYVLARLEARADWPGVFREVMAWVRAHPVAEDVPAPAPDLGRADASAVEESL